MTRRIHGEFERAAAGRWLAGVCAGLARARGHHVGWIRAAFALAVLAGGLGILVYVTCWLIIPGEGEEADARERAGVVVAARACAALLGLATLAAAAGTATTFGFGAVVVAAAAAILAATLVAWPRLSPAWAVLPVTALALPSLAVAAMDLRLDPSTGPAVVAPRTLADVPADGYRAGLGTLRVDLRKTTFPATGSVSMAVSGSRRTIVALPHDRCIHVRVRYRRIPFVESIASAVADRSVQPAVWMFGQYRWVGEQHETTLATKRGRRTPGPTLNLNFTTAGGSLYVRDYPDDVDPDLVPDWPGMRVYPEKRPNVTGTPKRAARRLIRHWRVRHRRQVRSARLVNRAIPGPCATKRVGR